MNSTGSVMALTDVNSTIVFPRGPLQRMADPFDLEQPWTAILYMIGDMYVFWALHLIVHRWFEPSILKMVDLFQMRDDVAGATLMAIGTSLPELVSGLVGVFVPGAGDTGLGTVLGSLVFNMLMITGLCIIVIPADAIILNRVDTIRDETCQVEVNGVLCWAFSNRQEDVHNDIVFLCLYVLYILVCWKAKDAARAVGCSDESDKSNEPDQPDHHSLHEHDARAIEIGSDDSSDSDHKHGHTLLAMPECNAKNIFFFILSIPLIILEACCHVTIPDSHSHFWKHHCNKTGICLCATMCIVWITILVFFMIEWAVKAGELLGIQPSIMGLTFCAAGTSVPDCMCSVLVAREGRGNMAISNVFGSNVFDVLIAMAIPWALRYQMMGTRELIKMEAEGFEIAVFILALVLIFYVACVAIGKFTLPKKVGYLNVGLYGIFIIYAFASPLIVFEDNS